MLLDTNILTRHLTQDPIEQARRATAFLGLANQQGQQLLLTDLIVAEIVYVLQSFYKVKRTRVAELLHSILVFPPIVVTDLALLLRAIEVYEVNRLDFAEAYLVACAERSGVESIASFDCAIDKIDTVQRFEPV